MVNQASSMEVGNKQRSNAALETGKGNGCVLCDKSLS